MNTISIKIFIIGIIKVLLLHNQLFAKTIYTDPSQELVQIAINNAKDGDTVVVKPGQAVWTNPTKGSSSIGTSVKIDSKGIVLRGGGDGNGITEITGSLGKLLVITSGNKFVRITGFTFILNDAQFVQIEGNGNAWRIDHCIFENYTQNKLEAVYINKSDAYGLIDHCLFKRNCRVVVVGANRGEDSWKTESPIGSSETVFIEDCYFYRDSISGNSIDANAGGRYVFRHNKVINSVCEAHSLQNAFSNGTFHRGTRSYEIYNNTFYSDGSKKNICWSAMLLRGGTGVVWGNYIKHITGGKYSFLGVVDNVRSFDSLKYALGRCDGTNPIDGNQPGKLGYPCLDQPGFGKDYGIGSDRMPQEQEPIYCWDNYKYGVLDTLVPRNDLGNVATHIKTGRDIINGQKKPGYRPFPFPHNLSANDAFYKKTKPQKIRIIKL